MVCLQSCDCSLYHTQTKCISTGPLTAVLPAAKALLNTIKPVQISWKALGYILSRPQELISTAQVQRAQAVALELDAIRKPFTGS